MGIVLYRLKKPQVNIAFIPFDTPLGYATERDEVFYRISALFFDFKGVLSNIFCNQERLHHLPLS